MIPVRIKTQPDDGTCGPTSLHAVYRYYKDTISLKQVIRQIRYLDEGGTLAVMLGQHALARGYRATIYTYNLMIFDPTWFGPGAVDLIGKLKQQLAHRRGKKIRHATAAYIDFLESGGVIRFEALRPALLSRYLKRKIPLLTGLSATYLYRCAREYTPDGRDFFPDDVKGVPQGHFVVLCGYSSARRRVLVADPYKGNPLSRDNYYSVDVDRLIHAILLGILTYDANLLLVEKG